MSVSKSVALYDCLLLKVCSNMDWNLNGSMKAHQYRCVAYGLDFLLLAAFQHEQRGLFALVLFFKLMSCLTANRRANLCCIPGLLSSYLHTSV